EHLGSPGRALASRPAEVLDGHRHAVEWTSRAPPRKLSLGNTGLGQDPLGVERDERVQRGLETLAAAEERLAELDRRQRPRGEAGAEVRDPEERELDVAQWRVPQSRAPARGSLRAIMKPRASSSPRAPDVRRRSPLRRSSESP